MHDNKCLIDKEDVRQEITNWIQENTKKYEITSKQESMMEAINILSSHSLKNNANYDAKKLVKASAILFNILENIMLEHSGIEIQPTPTHWKDKKRALYYRKHVRKKWYKTIDAMSINEFVKNFPAIIKNDEPGVRKYYAKYKDSSGVIEYQMTIELGEIE